MIQLPSFCESYDELWGLEDNWGLMEDGGYLILWTNEEQAREDTPKWRRITKRPRLVPERIK